MNNIVWTSRFIRAFKKISKQNPKIKSEIFETIKLLQENIFNPKLFTHKLKCQLTGCFACTVAYDLRIVFEMKTDPMSNEQEILLLTIGTHEQVY